ncbi:NAD-P-binding protein [Roridomyces roridus]|uniref:NAD-P-binding protein n=1 Tax=Roridomyces roridus TaxID=1738132 RepID=A0AAD7C998_9AGAR|nr:NAD-P-binding protein [Roridomyces roridus]
MPSLPAVQNSNASFKPSYLPVAVFLGGTSGIGRGTAEAFARYTSGNAHIILIGRNASAATSILSSFPKPNSTESGWKHEFIECDVSLIKNVNATLVSLLPRLPRVNFLVCSCGIFSFDDRKDTAEGLDIKLAVTYYARAVLMIKLLPALEAAAKAGQPASVVNVLAAGQGSTVELGNLGLKDGYTGQRALGESVTYVDLLHAELSAQHPTLAFTHTYPGFIDTPIARTAVKLLPSWDINKAGNITDAGEFTLYALLSAAPGQAHTKGEMSDDAEKAPVYGYGSSEESKAMLKHTEEVMDVNV